jgi:hypothetical protein
MNSTAPITPEQGLFEHTLLNAEQNESNFEEVVLEGIGKFQASCRLSVKILSSNLLLVSNLLGRVVVGFSLIRI